MKRLNGNIKSQIRENYIRCVKKLSRSMSNGRNVISGYNASTVVKSGAGVVEWSKWIFANMNRIARKIITMNWCSYPRRNVTRLYLPRTEGKRLLTVGEESVTL